MALPPQRYDAPSGRVGRLFVQAVADELKGVVQCSWNSERFVVFQAVILQRSPDVKRARDIRRRIKIRIRHWREKQFTMLVQDTVRTSRALISTMRRGMSEESVAKTFTSMVLKGKIRAAVRFATLRGEGGVLKATDIDEKTGKSVLEVLQSKHPAAVEPPVEELEDYDVYTDMLEPDITSDTVLEVAAKLSGAGGPGGVDAIELQQ